jgi:predicted Zn-dependent protease with MMP-like domain
VAGDHLDPAVRFEKYAQDAVDSLPWDLRGHMSNIEIVVEDAPAPGQPLLGLYQRLPLTRRGSQYGGALPDKITLYRDPLMRLYGHDADLLRREVRRVVLMRSHTTSESATSFPPHFPHVKVHPACSSHVLSGRLSTDRALRRRRLRPRFPPACLRSSKRVPGLDGDTASSTAKIEEIEERLREEWEKPRR